ncbi:MAG: guanylate kinase [Alphaproteobacteria bacterium]|nr:guanylate kinase [Rickettsiales bacterium]
MVNLIFIVSSASGVGKTTLCNMLKKKYKQLDISVSVTTRNLRGTEVNGVNYFFVTQDKFNQMINDGKFAEHATVYNHSYGTLKSEIERISENNKVPLFDIDWQGAKQIKENLEDYLIISVYLLPPSTQTLYNRLKNRQTDSKDIVDTRMKSFLKNIDHATEYDYVVVNDDLNVAFEDLCSIFEAGFLKKETMLKTKKLVSSLKKENISKSFLKL